MKHFLYKQLFTDSSAALRQAVLLARLCALVAAGIVGFCWAAPLQAQRKVVLGAVNQLADGKYDEAMNSFIMDGDWSAYAEKVDRLVQVYGNDWGKSSAMKKLVENLKLRAMLKTPPPVSGDGMDEEDVKLAFELAEHNGPKGKVAMFGVWLFEVKGKITFTFGAEDSPIRRIKKRGMRSIPLLIALLKDECFTRMDKNVLEGGVRQHADSEFENLPPERVIEKRYNCLRRPATRSEIAIALLKPLIIDKTAIARGSGDKELNLDAFAESVNVWYAANKEKRPLALAGNISPTATLSSKPRRSRMSSTMAQMPTCLPSRSKSCLWSNFVTQSPRPRSMLKSLEQRPMRSWTSLSRLLPSG